MIAGTGTPILDRGYTGHEMLPEFSLINMNGRLYDPILGRFLSPDNYVQLPDNTQNFNRYSYVLNNPLKYTDPSGEFFFIPLIAAYLLFTNQGYEIQKYFLPFAVHVDLAFGSHSNGLGVDFSVGVPQISPISYRYNFGATYYLNRIGGYGSGWQIRNGGEWSLGFGTIRYGGTRYRDYDDDGNLLVNQVNHTISVGRGKWRISYSNDSWGSFPWTTWGKSENDGKFFGLPALREGSGNLTGWNSDRYRTASGSLRIGNFELGFFLHTGEGDNWNWWNQNPTQSNPNVFTGGNIDRLGRSNGIIYGEYFGFKIGWDSEGIRQALQNDLVHDWFNGGKYGSAYPWVLQTGRNPEFVFQFGNF